MKAIISVIRAHPILGFTGLACFFGWILYIVAALGASLSPSNLPLGPIIAAAIVAGVGRGEWRTWTRALRTFRAPLGWYVLAIVSPVVIVGAAVLANAALGAPVPTGAQLGGWTDLPLTFVFMLLFVGVGEEAGWTAFAAPKLLSGQRFVTVWAILSAIRALWHLPLMLTGDLSWVLGVGGNFAFQFLLLWSFVRSGGVWFLAALWHTVLNTAGGEFFFPMVQGADNARLGGLVTAGYALLAVIVLLVDRRLRQSIRSGPAVLTPREQAR